MRLPGKSFFSPDPPRTRSLPPPPAEPETPTRAPTDETEASEEVTERRRRERLIGARSRGRASTILTDDSGLGGASVDRPRAGARLLGG